MGKIAYQRAVRVRAGVAVGAALLVVGGVGIMRVTGSHARSSDWLVLLLGVWAASQLGAEAWVSRRSEGVEQRDTQLAVDLTLIAVGGVALAALAARAVGAKQALDASWYVVAGLVAYALARLLTALRAP